MVNYQGKRKLYNFLKAQGFTVPKMKEMQYKFYRGKEWLRCDEIGLFRNFPNITVTTYAYDEEKDKDIEVGFFSYRNGECVYKREWIAVKGKWRITTYPTPLRALD